MYTLISQPPSSIELNLNPLSPLKNLKWKRCICMDRETGRGSETLIRLGSSDAHIKIAIPKKSWVYFRRRKRDIFWWRGKGTEWRLGFGFGWVGKRGPGLRGQDQEFMWMWTNERPGQPTDRPGLKDQNIEWRFPLAESFGNGMANTTYSTQWANADAVSGINTLHRIRLCALLLLATSPRLVDMNIYLYYILIHSLTHPHISHSIIPCLSIF